MQGKAKIHISNWSKYLEVKKQGSSALSALIAYKIDYFGA
jgi:hypothetical protein